MKIKCIQPCHGMGYENFKADEVRELPENIANTLIQFGYVEAVEKVAILDSSVSAVSLGSIANVLEMHVFSEETTENEKVGQIIAEIISLKAELAAEKKENEFLKAAGNEFLKSTKNLKDENGNDIILTTGDIKTDLGIPFDLKEGMKIITNTLQEYIFTGKRVVNDLYIEANEDKLDKLHIEYVDWKETKKANGVEMIGTECNLGETNVLIVETEEDKKARLIARAKELDIKGVLSNFGTETLEKKIAEAEAKL